MKSLFVVYVYMNWLPDFSVQMTNTGAGYAPELPIWSYELNGLDALLGEAANRCVYKISRFPFDEVIIRHLTAM